MRARFATWCVAALGALVLGVSPAAAQSTVTLAGTDAVGLPGSSANPGGAEVYRTTATYTGTATSISLYLDESSAADRLVLGLYSDDGGQPSTLLASGSASNPVAGWNKVDVSATPLTANQPYWIALLNPADSVGVLRWRDRADGVGGGAEQGSADQDLIALPATWESGAIYGDGPLSAYVSGTRTITQPPSLGLVGAWSFDETSGSTAGDASPHGNAGLISGASRVTGKYNGALNFDGVDDWVTIEDDSTLDLTAGMTLEAWVKPETLGTTWRTVLIKEQSAQLAYALYANTDGGVPSGHVFTSGDIGVRGPAPLPVNQWSHLATTWDGATLRVFVNAVEVASTPLEGTAVESSGALRIGGNAIWPEWFDGAIDEVRVYDRALTAVEIAKDRDTPIGKKGGGQPPRGDGNSWLSKLIRYFVYKFKKHHGHWINHDRGGHWLGYDGKPQWGDRDNANRWLQDALGRWQR